MRIRIRIDFHLFLLLLLQNRLLLLQPGTGVALIPFAGEYSLGKIRFVTRDLLILEENVPKRHSQVSEDPLFITLLLCSCKD